MIMNKSKNITSIGSILLYYLSQNMIMTKLLHFNRRFIVAVTEQNNVNQLYQSKLLQSKGSWEWVLL